MFQNIELDKSYDCKHIDYIKKDDKDPKDNITKYLGEW